MRTLFLGQPLWETQNTETQIQKFVISVAKKSVGKNCSWSFMGQGQIQKRTGTSISTTGAAWCPYHVSVTKLPGLQLDVCQPERASLLSTNVMPSRTIIIYYPYMYNKQQREVPVPYVGSSFLYMIYVLYICISMCPCTSEQLLYGNIGTSGCGSGWYHWPRHTSYIYYC